MNTTKVTFWQKINPFYWQRVTNAVMRELRSTEVELEQTLKHCRELTEKLDRFVKPYRSMAEFEDRMHDSKQQKFEAINAEMMLQANEELQKQVATTKAVQVEDLINRVRLLKTKLDQTEAAYKQQSDLVEEYRIEVKQLRADKAKAEEKTKAYKAKWEKLFKVILGYSPDDMVLLNRAFWGKQMELVEFGTKEKE